VSSLISDADKLELAGEIDQLHDTFAKDIYVYGEPIRDVIDPNTNPLYGYPVKKSAATLTENVTTIKARILMGKPSNVVLTSGGEGKDSVVELPAGWARIKVKAEHEELIKTSKRVKIGNDFYSFDSHKREHGLFSTDYLTFYLRPLNV
jgi:hypothetical protein